MIDLTKHPEEPQPQPAPTPVYYGAPTAGFVPYPMPTVVQPKKKTEFTRAELGFSFAVFLLSFMLIRFAMCSPTGFVTTAVFAGLITAALLFMKKSGIKGDRHTALTAGVMYVFSAVYFVTDNEFIKALNTLFLILCGLWLLYRYGSSDRRMPRFLPLVMLQAALEYPFSHFGKMTAAAAESGRRTKIGRNVGAVFAGLLITIIPTIVIGSLLISADSGVEKMLGGVTRFVTSKEVFKAGFQLMFAYPVGSYIYGAFFANSHRDPAADLSESACEEHLGKARRVRNMVIYTALTPICGLYTLFFISQANYLLSAFLNRLPEGFSHAEYARRGFFELLAIVIIDLFIICVSNLVAKDVGADGGKPAALRFYTGAVSFFTLVMIASALSKMVMYISEYGLTELRLYTGWFMVLCAFVFLLVIVKQFRRGMVIMRPLAAVFVVMFALLTFGRPDYVIARFNTEMYEAGRLERFDSDYLWSLSDDAKMYCLQNGSAPRVTNAKKYRKALDNTDISTIYVNGRM